MFADISTKLSKSGIENFQKI